MKIYKYHSININLLNSLRTKTNWYGKLSNLNDPHECFIIDDTGTDIYKNLISTLCVCCFSKNMDEILMWSHYADSHKGVCLEWEVDEDKVKGQLFDMKYENVITTLDKVERTPTGHLSLNIETNGKFIIQKFKNWKYEEELRTYIICEDNLKKGESKSFLGELAAIYFGKNSSNDNIELIKHNTQHIDNLKYKKVDINTNSMKMDIITNA